MNVMDVSSWMVLCLTKILSLIFLLLLLLLLLGCDYSFALDGLDICNFSAELGVKVCIVSLWGLYTVIYVHVCIDTSIYKCI